MAIQKENVTIDVQDIVDLLHSGYTWYKKDDLGYGSIQEKFNALDIHIKTIQKHPDLKDVDTIAKVFVITNRNKQENAGNNTTNAVDNSTDGISMESVSKTSAESTFGIKGETRLSEISNESVDTGREKIVRSEQSTVTADEELSAFANL